MTVRLTYATINQRDLKCNPLIFCKEFIQNDNYEIFKMLLNKCNRFNKENVSPLTGEYFDTLRRSRKQKQRSANRLLPEKAHHGGPCIPGAQRLFLNAYGEFYPCERVSEGSEAMKIGSLREGIDIEKARTLLNVGSITENQCKNCWAFRYCTLCAGAADGKTCLSAEKKQKECIQQRYNAETIFKDYCVLKEFGAKIEDDENMTPIL